ncbi:MAG: Ni/Fe hydrogenase subunit alpha [Anaerolineae bacterium]|nr:Ni/Fe hydrogenase subunit alpha [Anaerolineae bacterium]
MKDNKSRTIKVETLARVEGEGAMILKIKGDTVTEAKLNIYEPPRFFEAFLRGRAFREAPDITARICGICPVAYQMSACHAIEDALGVKVEGQLRALRRLLYCGEWIESHVLHVYMLHAPDFLGYQDVLAMAKDHPAAVKQALELKKLGNDIMILLGGREIHPINVRVGGFYRAPDKSEFAPLVERLKRGRDAALDMVRFAASLECPDFEQDYEFVALRHPEEYPLNEGRIVSSRGLNISVREFEEHFVEEHVPHSTSLHSVIKGRGAYLVGPLARFNLNYDRLSPLAQEAAQNAGIKPGLKNPFKSIVVRAVETVYAFDESLRILEQYEPPAAPFVPVTPRAGFGCGCTEAPRGILFHSYRLDSNGNITNAHIMPPTAQNQKSIESDLFRFAELALDLPEDKLVWQCEQAIRNYDPCISCSTHFLKVKIERE